MPELITIEEAARITGFPSEDIQYWAKSHKITSYSVTRDSRLVDLANLREFISHIEHLGIQKLYLQLIIEDKKEEADEIIGTMPSWIVRWGITLIFVLLALLFLGCYFIRYPQTVTGTITLTTVPPPVDVTAPTMIPTDATAMITRTGAALEPMAELRKLAASFITPMKRPVTARSAMAANINVYIGSILSNSGKCGTKIAFSPAGNNSVTYS
mgnify:CR=1 FL=1